MSDIDVYIEESRKRRGIIIEVTVTLERFIDIFIASHFCSDKHRKAELIYQLLTTRFLGAESKRQIFLELLDVHENGFYKENGDMLSKIRYIYTQRNLYAHHPILTNSDALKSFANTKAITLAKFDAKQVERVMPYEEYMQTVTDASECATLIRMFMEKRKYLPLYGDSRTV